MELNRKKRNTLAEKVIKIAQEKNVPLKDDPELMSILFKLDLGEDVPQEFYKVITEILTFVYNVSKKELKGKIAN
ncbi:EscU/YscU/HrcU family type III secretion system export apparatus switch protein [candidate division KSB1 bacterium]